MSEPETPRPAAGQPVAIGRKTILGNALSLTAGSAVAQALMALSILLVARQLGPAAFGTYAGSFSAAALLGIGFNLGLDTWLLRAGAARRDQLGGLLRNALLIKLAAGIPWVLAVVLLLPALNADTFRAPVVLVAALTVWAEGLFGLGLSVFRALLRNGTTAALMLASRGGIFALTVALALTGERAVLPYAFIRLGVGAAMLLVAWRMLPVKPARVDGVSPAVTARASLPFALSDLFTSVYVQADVTIAAIVLGSEAVGLYAPASSLIAALFVVPTALFYVAVPVLTPALGGDPARLRRRLRWTLAIFAATGLAMWVLTWLVVDLVPVVLGQTYARSGELLRILSPILLLKGFSFGAAAILVAVGWQTRRMIVQAAAAVLNVALNLAVVSTFGISGVAAVYVVSEVFLAAGYLALVAGWRRASRRALQRA